MELGTYASVDGQYFCRPHYQELFRLKGNYTEGFGTPLSRALSGASPPPGQSPTPAARISVSSPTKTVSQDTSKSPLRSSGVKEANPGPATSNNMRSSGVNSTISTAVNSAKPLSNPRISSSNKTTSHPSNTTVSLKDMNNKIENLRGDWSNTIFEQVMKGASLEIIQSTQISYQHQILELEQALSKWALT
uniref:LIM zinc-binding domain-containing protein n=1 Tax=Arcella intermedia TaxID=1963864 RepID=A0A6B2LHJ3_9EUKA